MTKIKQVDLKNTREQTHKHWGTVSSMNIMMSQHGNLSALLAFLQGIHQLPTDSPFYGTRIEEMCWFFAFSVNKVLTKSRVSNGLRCHDAQVMSL